MAEAAAIKENEIEQSPEKKGDGEAKERAVEQALQFWTHPSVAGISPDEKLQYLRTKQGLTDDDIYQLWEKLTKSNGAQAINTSSPASHPSMAAQSTAVPSAQPSQLPPQYPSQYAPQSRSVPPYYEQPEQPQDSSYIPALLAVGGALGLAAAASVRWLNGGDFTLFPPPSRGKDIIPSGRESRHVEIEATGTEEELMEGDGEYSHEDDEAGLLSTNQIDKLTDQKVGLHEQLQQLVEIFQTSSQTQEALLQKLVASSTKDFTDKSMRQLRGEGENAPNVAALWLTYAKLLEIKGDLETIKGSSSIDEQESKLARVIGDLDDCMSKITSSVEDRERKPKVSLLSSTLNPPSVSTKTPTTETAPLDGKMADELDDTTVPRVAVSEGSSSSSHPLGAIIETLATKNDLTALREGAQLLYLYVINLSSHPHVPRYRKIFTSNASFEKVGGLKGGRELLCAVGFVEVSKNCLEWRPRSDSAGEKEDDEEDSGEDEALLLIRLNEAAAALSVLKTAGPDRNRSDLVSAALASLPDRPVTAPTSPLTSDSSPEVDHVFTPPPNFLISPPVTKRDPFLPTPPSCQETTGKAAMMDASPVGSEKSLSAPVLEEETGTRLFTKSPIINRSDDGEFQPTESVEAGTASTHSESPSPSVDIKD